mmetsp:Transcript_25320/g.39964  ORF Transcript_25320/g.39964 Transcript_25320/m.39964 type:complete len:86 (-) Transcript_25320:556-813(-)
MAKKFLNKKSTTTKRNSRDWDGDRRKKKAAKVNPVKTDWKGPAEHTMVHGSCCCFMNLSCIVHRAFGSTPEGRKTDGFSPISMIN